ncbi:glycosyltransferase family 39 protein [Candidatus Curtissbacteria bacterium]|nr:glycosyltransferase family 39 protein [Candidatus Curtissbacteria bacterium]
MFPLTENYLTRGFWGDEAWTSLISQLPYLQMLKTTAADFHPPGYYTVVELWYKVFPPTEVSTRIVSIVFYFLTIFLVYKLASLLINSTSEEPPSTASTTLSTGLLRASELTSEVNRDKVEGSKLAPWEVISKKRFWGLLSAIVVAVNPIFFTYAFEARNYTMFAFASVGSIYFLIGILNKSTSEVKSTPTSQVTGGKVEESKLAPWEVSRGGVTNVIFFILFSTLGIYTHYYMFLTLFAQGFYIVLFHRKILLKMIGIYAIIGLLYLPWMPFLLGQLKSVGSGYWIGPIDGKTHWEAILRILSGEFENGFRPFLLTLSIGLILTGFFQHLKKRILAKAYILIWFWAVVPFILATLPGLSINGFKLPFRPIFFWRYLIPASVPLSLIILQPLRTLKLQPLKILTLITVIALSLTIDYLTLTRYPYTFRQVYEQKVLPEIASRDKIVTVLPSFAEVLYYRNRFRLDNELIILPEGIVQFSGKSLLDAYVQNGVVKIDDNPAGRYFELRPGPSIEMIENSL